MAKQEIKCPHCGQWTKWKGELHDCCGHCTKLLEQEKIDKLQQQEKKKQMAEELEKQRIAKQNPFFRKIFGYASTAFIGFILLILAVIALMAG